MVRVTIRVRPGSKTERVGGRWGDGDVLLVAVRAPATDGKANAAVVNAVADAFGVARRDVQIVHGERSRTKLVDISGPVDELGSKLRALLV